MEIVLVLWGLLLISLLAIGGYFMFRKFLKQIPKADGKSVMDWEIYYVEKSKHMWGNKEREFLEELVSPVPELFRDVARQKIASKIGERTLSKKQKTITEETIIEGYILATPKRDHKFLRKKLKEKNIEVAPYEHLFNQSRSDYEEDWEQKYRKEQKKASQT
ncbi:DUF2621 family protein [Oceanobacillus piezotolerans]|uniref:DUF2621 family protein n=1 Tax=Oceanobacillus piezotolerans TaxID=2448030 RepID=A0A498D6P9_9BACI|nr:DUF2621 family protein [Oceanobacillus piezotolerans]RLL45418.1 DUF2621 family protein [Oceanobacillus piezotolerans]